MLNKFVHVLSLLFCITLFNLAIAEDKPIETKQATKQETKQDTNNSQEKPLFTVGDIVITETQFLKELEKLPIVNSESKTELLDKMIETEVLYKSALNAGLDKDPTITNIKEPEERKKILINKFIENVIAKDITVSEDEMKKYYDLNKEIEFNPPVIYRTTILHIHKFDRSYKNIFDAAKNEAVKIREKLIKGENPKDIWNSYSTHDTFMVQMSPKAEIKVNDKWLPKEIKDILPSMKIGDISPVYEEKNSFAIFKINEIIAPEKTLSFDEVKQVIQERVKKSKIDYKKREYVWKYIKENNGVLHNLDLIKQSGK
jgi:foldase protein PrsA